MSCVVVDYQLEEIRNIGSLPCLEKLNLSGNPVCIFPDYRTKVLAQFGDRAAEVQQHQNQHTSNLKASLVVMLHLLHRRNAASRLFDVALTNSVLRIISFLNVSSYCGLQTVTLIPSFSTVLCLCVIRFVSTARRRQKRSWTRSKYWKPFRKLKKSKTGRAAAAAAAGVAARRYVLPHWAEEQQQVYTVRSLKTWWMFVCKCSTNLMAGCWPIPLLPWLFLLSQSLCLPTLLVWCQILTFLE